MASTIRQAVLFTVAVVGALGVVSLVGKPNKPPEPKVVGKELQFWGFAAVEGTDVFRASLNEPGSGYSSSGYSGTTRNILFIDKDGKGRWLLPDHTQEIAEHPVARTETYGQPTEPAIATFALVKPSAPETQDGRLLLFDPTGRSIQEVAKDVAGVEATTYTKDEIAVLYRLRGSYMLSAFQRSTLAKVRDTPVTVPVIKQVSEPGPP